MNAKQQAAADLRRLSQMLKGIIAIGDDLEALGSIEQAVAEAQSRIIKLQGDEAALKQRLAEMDVVLATAQQALTATVQTADDRAADITANAVGGAKSILEQAARQAANIVQIAKQSSVDMDADLKDKRGLLRSLNTDINVAQSRLDEVNAKLSELRKRL